jgi:hypothetical protein
MPDACDEYQMPALLRPIKAPVARMAGSRAKSRDLKKIRVSIVGSTRYRQPLLKTLHIGQFLDSATRKLLHVRALSHRKQRCTRALS